MKKQELSWKAGGQQGHTHVKARQQRNEDGGTTHGESVLEAQRHRLARAHPLVRFCARKQEIVQFFEAVHSCMLLCIDVHAKPRGRKNPLLGPHSFTYFTAPAGALSTAKMNIKQKFF